MYVVDHLLDILTGNEHRKTSKYIEEMKNLRKGKYIIFCQNQFSSTLKQGFNEFLGCEQPHMPLTIVVVVVVLFVIYCKINFQLINKFE